MARNGEEQGASNFSNNTKSVTSCSTNGLIEGIDVYDITSPWIQAAFASITAPIAFLLNAMIILAVKQRRELQRLSNILITSMAVADLLIGGIGVPLSVLVGLLLPYQILTVQHYCLINLVAYMLMCSSSFCSLIHLTMIAWERYIAIRRWADYKTIVTRSRLKKMAIVAWVIAVVAQCFQYVIREIMTALVGEDTTTLALANTILSIGWGVLIACILVLIVFFYIMIYLGVRKRKLNQIHQVKALIQAKLENRVAMTTAVVTIALILSFFPGVIVIILEEFYPALHTRFAWKLSDSLLRIFKFFS